MSQDPLFGEPAAATTAVPRETPPTIPVPRSPGWVLVGTTTGPQGFHRVRTTSSTGSLITACGLVGRKIAEAQTTIVECPDCQMVLAL